MTPSARRLLAILGAIFVGVAALSVHLVRRRFERPEAAFDVSGALPAAAPRSRAPGAPVPAETAVAASRRVADSAGIVPERSPSRPDAAPAVDPEREYAAALAARLTPAEIRTELEGAATGFPAVTVRGVACIDRPSCQADVDVTGLDGLNGFLRTVSERYGGHVAARFRQRPAGDGGVTVRATLSIGTPGVVPVPSMAEWPAR